MELETTDEGVLRITYEHADPDFAQLLLMADFGANDMRISSRD